MLVLHRVSFSFMKYAVVRKLLPFPSLPYRLLYLRMGFVICWSTRSDAAKRPSSVWKTVLVIWIVLLPQLSSSPSCSKIHRRRPVLRRRPATKVARSLPVDGRRFRRCTAGSASAYWQEGRRPCGWESPTPPCTCCCTISPTTCPLQHAIRHTPTYTIFRSLWTFCAVIIITIV